MIADSSNISEEKVQKILQDNDLLDATVNATKNAIYAFPFLDVISRLNDRVNELSATVSSLRSRSAVYGANPND